MSGLAATILPHLRVRLRSYGIGLTFLVATNACALAVPWVLKLAIEDLEAGRGTERLDRLVVALVALAVTGAASRIISRAVLFGAARDVERELRDEATAQLLHLGGGYAERTPTGDLISRVINDVSHLRMLLGPGLLNAVNSVLAYGASLSMMLWLSPLLTFQVLVPVPFFLVAGRVFMARLYERSRAVQEQLGRLNQTVEENLAGHAVVRSFAREEHEVRGFEAANHRQFEATMRHVRTQAAMTPIMGAFGGIGVIVVVWGGGRLVVDGRLTLGALMAFAGYLAILLWPTMAVGWVLSIVQRARSAASRLREVLDARPLLVDPPAPVELPPARGALETRALTVRHPSASRDALRGIDLALAPGERVALVGPTGSGKSTLLAALARRVEVPEGSVFVDGVDVRAARLDDVRARTALVPQTPFLFSDSIRANVALDPRADAGTACERAGLAPDLADMPRGLDTRVGERGTSLSVGQRQRVALARALAAEERPVLLLDDPFSAVDADTEERILEALDDALGRRTVLLATHRLEAVRLVDRVVVLDDGCIVEQGTHDELLARDGLYAELVARARLERAVAEEAR